MVPFISILGSLCFCVIFSHVTSQSITCNCSHTNHTHNHHFLVVCTWQNFPTPSWAAIYGKEKIDNSVQCLHTIGSPECPIGNPGSCFYRSFGIEAKNGIKQVVTAKPHLVDGENYYVLVWEGPENSTCHNSLGSTALHCYIGDETSSELTPLVLLGGILIFVLLFAGLGFIRWKEYHQHREEPALKLHTFAAYNHTDSDQNDGVGSGGDTNEEIYYTKMAPEAYFDKSSDEEEAPKSKNEGKMDKSDKTEKTKKTESKGRHKVTDEVEFGDLVSGDEMIVFMDSDKI